MASTKSQPFSIRLSQATDRLVEAEAARTRRSKSAIVEALTEEAARARRFPGIAFRGDDSARRPWIVGSGLDIWEVIQMLEDFGSKDALETDSQLTMRQIDLALAYQRDYSEEIDEAVAENRRPVDELRSLYPFVRFEPGAE